MAAILLTAFLNSFLKCFCNWLKFHFRLLIRAQLAIRQQRVGNGLPLVRGKRKLNITETMITQCNDAYICVTRRDTPTEWKSNWMGYIHSVFLLFPGSVSEKSPSLSCSLTLSHFANDIFKWIFMNETFCFLFEFNWSLFLWVHLTMSQHWFG